MDFDFFLFILIKNIIGESKMKHDYHFVLNEKAYLKILELANQMDRSVSGTIVVLFEKLLPFLEKNHLSAKVKNSKYKIIAGKNEKRIHIHSYIPEYDYMKMKQLHFDLDVYSLAQILRELINKFISGCLKYGIEKFIDILKKIQDMWEKKKESYKKEKIIFKKQLSHKNVFFPYILIKYNNKSQIYDLQFI
jgi:hypothetical protein